MRTSSGYLFVLFMALSSHTLEPSQKQGQIHTACKVPGVAQTGIKAERNLPIMGLWHIIYAFKFMR